MNKRLGVLLLGLAAMPAFAVNFSGKWALPGGGRGGPTILTLNHVGSEVTGSISGRGGNGGSGAPVNTEVLGGKVEGDVLTFYVWTGNDQPLKTTYKGTMSPSGDEIQFMVTGGRGGAGGMGGGGGQGGAPARGATGSQALPAAAATGRGQASGPQQVVAKRAK